MKPLQVTAIMRRELEWERPVALDGLLARVEADRRGLHRPRTLDEVVPIDIPVQRSPCGRFHLASMAHAEGLLYTREQYIHKRAPHEWYAFLCGDKVKRVNIAQEPDKSWRICKAGYRYDRVSWWCVGDADAIREMLRRVTRIGARRRHGIGLVREWHVARCSTWEGFPILRDGLPLRNLPTDYPGLAPGHAVRRGRLTFPYHLSEGVELLACPRPQ